MHFTPFALMRPAAFALAGLTALAVALGRTAADRPEGRSDVPVRYHAINWYLLPKDEPVPRFLDVETGRVTTHKLGDSAYHKYLSCAPWRDAHGHSQIVGLPGVGTAAQAGPLGHEISLARYTFPEGRLLDQVSLDSIIPTSAPCWFPGRTARVLFGAADGRLYRLSFPEDGRPSERRHDDLLNPVPLVWERPPANGGRLWMSDPSWPTAAGFGGRVVASLTFSREVGSGEQPAGGQIWWLQLDAAGRTIRDAGRLTVPGSEVSERWPSLATTADGQLRLAYLVRQKGEPGWRLRTAAVTVDPLTGAPRAGQPVSPGQAGEGLAFPPAFSVDGQRVHILTRRPGRGTAVERFAFTGAEPDAGRLAAVAQAP